MLVAPYSTDAPLYHLPIVTGGLIITNIVIFFATTFQLLLGNVEIESIEWLILQFDTINPLQWITGAFMHAGLMHLLGNMFFLWAFGLVIEGKLGGPMFLGIYMLIAAVDGAVVQLPMFLLGSDGGALGASGVIFALMVMAVLWAPENEMDCFYFAGIWFGTFEIRIVTLGGLFMAFQVFNLWLGGFAMSSEMLHMIGAAIGAVVGLVMLRKDMVDCEGWDFVSRSDWLKDVEWLKSPSRLERARAKEDESDPIAAALGTRRTVAPAAAVTLAGSPLTATTPASASRQPASSPGKKLGRGFLSGKRAASSAPQAPDPTAHPDFNRLSYLLRQAIESGQGIIARQHYQRLSDLQLVHGLPDKLLASYVKLLTAEKDWVAALGPLQLVADRGEALANQAKTRIAWIQLNVIRNPQAAMQVLQQIDLPANATGPEAKKLLAMRNQLLAAAKTAAARA